MFAVCEELNERIILTADTVNKLELLQQYNIIHIPENVVAMTSTVADEVDDQSVSSDNGDIMPLDGSSDIIGSITPASSHDRIIDTSSGGQPDVDINMRSADYILRYVMNS